MANTQINITENGTKTLATAGKYCDRNIDVNVNVPAKATQFTNWLDQANGAVFELNKRCNSSGQTPDYDAVMVVTIPYSGDTSVEIRARGCTIYESYVQYSEDNGVTFATIRSSANHADVYGDRVVTRQVGANVTHIRISLCSPSAFNNSFRTETVAQMEHYSGCILTINEPIGNGGYAE